MRRFIIGIITASAVIAASLIGLAGCGGGTAADDGYGPPHYGGGEVIDLPDPTLRYYTFRLNAAGTGYVITEIDRTLSGDVKVPAFYKDLPVTAVGDRAFADRRKITTLILPPAVTSIGAYAFDNCQKLKSVELPAALTAVGEWGFCGCAALTAVVLPAELTTIGAYAFWGCDKLKNAVFAARDGWRAYWSSDAPVGVDLAADTLGDPSVAAAMLKTTYNYCRWQRAAALQ